MWILFYWYQEHAKSPLFDATKIFFFYNAGVTKYLILRILTMLILGICDSDFYLCFLFLFLFLFLFCFWNNYKRKWLLQSSTYTGNFKFSASMFWIRGKNKYRQMVTTHYTFKCGTLSYLIEERVVQKSLKRPHRRVPRVAAAIWQQNVSKALLNSQFERFNSLHPPRFFFATLKHFTFFLKWPRDIVFSILSSIIAKKIPTIG